MKILLDTHTFLWWITNDPHLSTRASQVIADVSHDVFISAASCWEIAMKAQRGRLILPDTPEKYISQQIHINNFQSLPIYVSHALQVYNLPDLHRDPFDRLLIAQSQVEGFPIVSGDAEIARYDVNVIW
jgi:PIN domain nuclease of toxin-antitoxin system